MLGPKDWKGKQWGGIAAAMALVVLASKVLLAVQGPFEPILPATREYVRDEIKLVSDANAKGISTMREAIATAEGNTEDLKVLILQGQMQNLEAEINTVNLRLKETPDDQLVEALLKQYQQQKADVREQLDVLQCKQLRRRLPDARC